MFDYVNIIEYLVVMMVQHPPEALEFTLYYIRELDMQWQPTPYRLGPMKARPAHVRNNEKERTGGNEARTHGSTQNSLVRHGLR